jgi:hypothetical protein
MKIFSGQNVRNTIMLRRLLWLSVCEYTRNTKNVAHNTHQISHISKLVFKRLSHRSSISCIPTWRESLLIVDRHRCLHVHVTCGILVLDYTMSHVTCWYCLKHKVTLTITCWERPRCVFTVWLLVKVFVLSILQLQQRPSHWHLHVFWQPHPVDLSETITIYYWNADKQVWTVLTETKHCSHCTVDVVCFVQNVRYM